MRSYWYLPIVPLLFGGACTREAAEPTRPQESQAGTLCALDGMALHDYPGPKAQIRYADGEVEFFCDTVEMFAIVLRPERRRRSVGIYTQDMGRADWKAPRGAWIDATRAWYVRGSRLHGSMGPTLAAFARQEQAAAFVGRYGGEVLAFAQVTPAMADLRGGADDGRM